LLGWGLRVIVCAWSVSVWVGPCGKIGYDCYPKAIFHFRLCLPRASIQPSVGLGGFSLGTLSSGLCRE
jgi:hypothetical protein